MRYPAATLMLGLLLCGLGLGMQGCSSVNATARRAGTVALGSAAGGLAGHVLGEGDSLTTGAGAVAGGLLASLSLGRDPETLQQGFDQGYVRGQSDAIKRHYFLRQALERKPLVSDSGGGSPVTYLMPGPQHTPDGAALAPHLVGTTVRE